MRVLPELTFAWRGKPVGQMSREELVDAVKYLAAENERLSHSLAAAHTRNLANIARQAA